MSRLGRGQPQQPAIVLGTPAGAGAATATATETATTTTAATVSGLGTPPIVVQDLTGTYWSLERQRPAIVSATPPGLVTADVSDVETVVTTATASASSATGGGTQPIVVTADPARAFWNQQHQPPAIVSATPPGLATADVSAVETVSTTTATQLAATVSTTETATTTTAATVSGLGTAPIVVQDLTGTYWSLQRQRPAALVVAPPGQVTADVTATETVSSTVSAQTQPQAPAQPTVVTSEPSKAFWTQAHQAPAILSATPPGQVSATVSATETATTTTAATVTGQGTPPIVVSDLTGTYWSLERQRPAIVIISPPGKTTGDVADTETVSTTATAGATAPSAPAQPVVYSDQLGPYLRSALSHQPPALLIVPPAGAAAAQVADTITVQTTATATLGGGTADVADSETAETIAAATAVAPGPGSWWKLLTLVRQSQEPIYRSPRMMSCPNDGTPFRSGPDGELYCAFDGYRPGLVDPEFGMTVGP